MLNNELLTQYQRLLEPTILTGAGVGVFACSARGVLLVRTQPQGGGGYPPLYRPQNGCTEQWVLWAPEILF